MFFVKALLGMVVMAGLLAVAVLNSGQTVNIHLTSQSRPTLSNVELPLALLGSFVLGAFVWFFVSLFQVIAAKSEVAALKRKNRELARELTDLRNMPVRDLDLDSFDVEPAGGETRES